MRMKRRTTIDLDSQELVSATNTALNRCLAAVLPVLLLFG